MDSPNLIRVLNAIGMQVREVLADSSFQTTLRVEIRQDMLKLNRRMQSCGTMTFFEASKSKPA